MEIKIVDAAKEDVEKLIEIYSAPHLYHTKDEASRYVKLFHDYHHVKVVKVHGVLAGCFSALKVKSITE